jgi:hypothetical protein
VHRKKKLDWTRVPGYWRWYRFRFKYLGDPSTDHMVWNRHQWELTWRAWSFELKFARDHHVEGCTCDRAACEEARH